MITPIQLSKILFEEFERDSWGDIDPNAFQHPATSDSKYPDGFKPDDYDEEYQDEMAGLYEVLERVCERINKNNSK